MAAKFRFRLETVLKLRKQEQETHRRAVAEAIRAVGQAEERVGQLSQELKSAFDQRRETQRVSRIDVSSLRGHQIYQGWLQRRILESGIELGERQRMLAERRARLADASKRLKVIEKLRERQLARHELKLRREEQAGQDEIGAQIHMRGLCAARRAGEES
jgi:flagellar FliJ protein